MAKLKLATAWLGGCSGCHMSFLDLDEWLIDLVAHVDLVYSPLMDIKRYPADVDLVLVEGAVANEDNRDMAYKLRRSSKVVISFGDCAVTGNVTALRNPLGTALEVLRPVYQENGDHNARIPEERGIVPVLLDRVQPLHTVIPVDLFLPGCPPPAPRIRAVLEAILQGQQPHLDPKQIKFG